MTKVETYRYQNPVELGSTLAGDVVFLGGFSGLVYSGTWPDSGNLRFFTLTDRGPNADAIQIEGRDARPFALPAFQPEILEIELEPADFSIRIRARRPLFAEDGRPLTGLPNSDADELALDLRGRPLAFDPHGCDGEGLARAEDGTFWIAEEYGPYLLHVNEVGRVLARHAMPVPFCTRQRNRGFEGLTREGTKLYALLQSPLLRGRPETSVRGIRLVEWDLRRNCVGAIYLYYPGGDPAETKIGDITALGDGRILVLEQNGEVGAGKAVQRIFEIDINGASDISGVDDSARPLETLRESELLAAGVRPPTRKLWLDLKDSGVAHLEKLEGLASLGENKIAIVNDNDFGLAGGFDPATGRLSPCPQPVTTEIRVITR